MIMGVAHQSNFAMIRMEGDERCLYYAMQQFGRRCCQMPEVAICFFQIAGEGLNTIVRQQIKYEDTVLMCRALRDVLCLTYKSQHTTVQHHIAACVETIALIHFTAGRPLYVSTPRDELEDTNTSLTVDNMQMVNYILMRINDKATWPLLMFTSDKTDENTETIAPHHSYITFMWSRQGDSICDSTQEQLELTKYSPSWNPRGRFLVIVITGDNSESHMSISRHVCEIMWNVSRIVNVIIIIPNSRSVPTESHIYDKSVAVQTLDVYTWFPYQTGNCGQVKYIVLIDQWMLESNGRFSANTELFLLTIPNNFMGCPIRVTTIGYPPFVILAGNYTGKDGETRYNIHGYVVEDFLPSVEKINLTVNFLSQISAVPSIHIWMICKEYIKDWWI